MKQVLKERGINVEWMWETLQNPTSRLKNQSSLQFIEAESHSGLFLPKFHPELNPIERVWAQSKQDTKAYCIHTLPSLRATVTLGLDSISIENIQTFRRKCRQYVYAYFEGHVAGSKLEEHVKKHKKAVKFHRGP